MKTGHYLSVSHEGLHRLGVTVKGGNILETNAAHDITSYCTREDGGLEVFTQSAVIPGSRVEAMDPAAVKEAALSLEKNLLSWLGAEETQKEGANAIDSHGKVSELNGKTDALKITEKGETPEIAVSVECRCLESFFETKEGTNNGYSSLFWQGTVLMGEREYIVTAATADGLFSRENEITLKEAIELDLRIDSLPERPLSMPEDMPILLTGYSMDQILITGWMTFSEKSYALGGTPFAGKLGERIGTDALTIMDLPEIGDEVFGSGLFSLENSIGYPLGYPKRVDALGVSCEPRALVSRGTLTGLLLEQGNSGRTRTLVRGTAPTITPTNTVIIPGQRSLQEIIAGTRDGILIYDVFDQFHGLNTGSGAFEYPCRIAYIQGGKLTGKTSHATMSGNLRDFLSGVRECTNHLTVLPLVIMETYTVASPAVVTQGIQFR